MARHVMTSRRRAALRKAQLASARKRRGRGRRVSKRAAVGVAVVGVGAVAIHGSRTGARLRHVSRTAHNSARRERKDFSANRHYRRSAARGARTMSDIAAFQHGPSVKSKVFGTKLASYNKKPVSSKRANRKASVRRSMIRAV